MGGIKGKIKPSEGFKILNSSERILSSTNKRALFAYELIIYKFNM